MKFNRSVSSLEAEIMSIHQQLKSLTVSSSLKVSWKVLKDCKL